MSHVLHYTYNYRAHLRFKVGVKVWAAVVFDPMGHLDKRVACFGIGESAFALF